MSNKLTEFEEFALAYLTEKVGKDAMKDVVPTLPQGHGLDNYILVINDQVITTVVKNKEELQESISGALSINAESKIEVYQRVVVELIEEETTEDTAVHEADIEIHTHVEEPSAEEESCYEVPEEKSEEETYYDIPEEKVEVVESFDEVEAELDPYNVPEEKVEAEVIEEVTALPEPEPELPKESPKSSPKRKPKPKPKQSKPKSTKPKKGTKSTDIPKDHTIGQYDEEGNLVATYEDKKAAALAAGIVNPSNITKVINGQRKTAGGFDWKIL